MHVEDVHDWLCGLFLLPRVIEIAGKEVIARGSTSRLSARDHAAYFQQVDAFAAEDLGLILPHPDDLYHETMARLEG